MITETHSALHPNQLKITPLRLAAFWAFFEAAPGGILHALKIPFRGLLLTSVSVLSIVLIAYYSKKNQEILKSLLIVLIIKGIVSPHSPVTAYLALTLQGLMGYLFFSTKRYFRTSALLLGVFGALFSGIQKIFILTLIFGNTLWNSINIFSDYVISEVFGLSEVNFNLSIYLIGTYIIIHILFGIFVGIISGKMPDKLTSKVSAIDSDEIIRAINWHKTPTREKGKYKSWWKRPTGLLVIFLSVAVVIISYLNPEYNNNIIFEILFMLIRSVVLLGIWYYLLSPFLIKTFKRYINRRQSDYNYEVKRILNLLPVFRSVVGYTWDKVRNLRGLKKLKMFFGYSLLFLLIVQNYIEE
ncbi:MAG: hypothetical protein Kow0098_09520 [Ignavibacteriaceae bacterium]